MKSNPLVVTNDQTLTDVHINGILVSASGGAATVVIKKLTSGGVTVATLNTVANVSRFFPITLDGTFNFTLTTALVTVWMSK